MDLKALQAQRADTIVEYAGEKVKLTYAPHKYTSRTQNNFVELNKEADPQLLADALGELLIDWDMYDGKVKIGTDAKSIMESGVPFTLQLSAVNAIMADMRDQKNATRSSATSEPAPPTDQ